MKVHEAKSKDGKARRHDDTAYLPLQARWSGEGPCATVVGDSSWVTSLVTARGICIAAPGPEEAAAKTKVPVARAKRSLVRQVADLIEDAVTARQGHQVFRLPVVGADGRVFGILAVRDLQPFGRSHKDNGERVEPIEAALVVVCTAWSREMGVVA